MDVAVLDPQRVNLLRTVFWDMTKITTAAETVEIPAGGNASASTEKVLIITITARTPDDMRVFYSFTSWQNEALDELLANSDMLMALAGDLTISSQDARELLADLPEDLSPERRAWYLAGMTAGAHSVRSRRQAAPPPAPTGPTGWTAAGMWTGYSITPRVESTSSATVEALSPSIPTA